MSRQTTLYNSFTGMGLSEKQSLVEFLCSHAAGAHQSAVQEALDYALKRKPSFGGYILTTWEGRKIVAAIVVNRTGMEGFSPNNLCSYVAIDGHCADQEDILQQLIEKAIIHANGDLALHLEPDHPALRIYQRLGFRAQYLELRLHKPPKAAIA